MSLGAAWLEVPVRPADCVVGMVRGGGEIGPPGLPCAPSGEAHWQRGLSASSSPSLCPVAPHPRPEHPGGRGSRHLGQEWQRALRVLEQRSACLQGH